MMNSGRVIGLLRRILRECETIYRDAAKVMIQQHPTSLAGRPERFAELMEDLNRGLIIKVYVTMVRADNRWTGAEKRVAAEIIEFLWNQRLEGNELREAAAGLFTQADQLDWSSLVAPFVRYQPLNDIRANVNTVVMRLANLIVKCDGQSMPEESEALHRLQDELDQVMFPSRPPSVSPASGTRQAQGHEQSRAPDRDGELDLVEDRVLEAQDREKRLQQALTQLDRLVGLDAVKERVRSYANFLKLQEQRRSAGLTTMPINLHMAFVGNPGTGKTTVARIVGQILGAMGTLASGHVVETDRSGLVAAYAGQTAGKTNQICDSALDGILFIDEAYSLVDQSGDDSYGREAIQVLLKRMEDDRQRLVVILAGYHDEMNQMIRSNPGLSSRINTRIEFDDYSPSDMGRIFESMCNENQYKLPSDARHRLLVGFEQLHRQRDRHFGNGRLVRNAFEDSVRGLADRVASVTALSEELLTTLTVDDIRFAELDPCDLDQLIQRLHHLRVKCSGCSKRVRIQPASLGGKVRCKSCGHVQLTPWADVDSPNNPMRSQIDTSN